MEKKHSGFGIASFIMSIIVGISMFVVFIVAGVLEVSTPGGLKDSSEKAMMIGLLAILCLLLDLVALGLGIAGIREQDKKKVFAILGTIFSSATILVTILLIIAGTVMK